jgi:hypothetical protein
MVPSTLTQHKDARPKDSAQDYRLLVFDFHSSSPFLAEFFADPSASSVNLTEIQMIQIQPHNFA